MAYRSPEGPHYRPSLRFKQVLQRPWLNASTFCAQGFSIGPNSALHVTKYLESLIHEFGGDGGAGVQVADLRLWWIRPCWPPASSTRDLRRSKKCGDA